VDTTRLMTRLRPLFAVLAMWSASGCQVAQERMRAAGYFAATQAGYAGRFRLAYGRWPADANQLEEFMCMRDRAERFKLARVSCDRVVNLSYNTELIPEGKHLRMRFRDSTNALLCSLRVRAPSSDEGSGVFPRIVITTSLAACRRAPTRYSERDGKRWLEEAP
jgi:hypothetical protein